ncbi:MAG: hypothetical protein ACK5MT_01375 [Actinomycetales bacterium]
MTATYRGQVIFNDDPASRADLTAQIRRLRHVQELTTLRMERVLAQAWRAGVTVLP